MSKFKVGLGKKKIRDNRYSENKERSEKNTISGIALPNKNC
jgi:hypothetical protein